MITKPEKAALALTVCWRDTNEHPTTLKGVEALLLMYMGVPATFGRAWITLAIR